MQVKKNPRADLSRKSLIFFQIGLIFVLALVYYGIEWKFNVRETSSISYETAVPELTLEDIPVTEVKELLPPPPPPPIPEFIEVIPDELEVEETEIRSTETNQEERMEKIVEVAEIIEEKIEEKVEAVPFVLIEEVPLYPGCENKGDNEARKKCMSAKINELVRNEFNTSLGDKLNLYGINRIFVIFKIDENGKVTDIKTRGPHKALEAEAERVIKLLPQMMPGKQRNRPVSVLYNLPITFEVKNL
ncbi:energy transducer TonB [Gramella sp. AN32]|uniref:Energy transducer TonB n=1 Tax=Christiangramia antarctica TaxID=2058158 RepID=A0ABW5X6M7_9FLAO|nr:energy transducer TonB [Gramella sp. AN32]MCM4154737.1 energy transducer TonB [Gramella sp. AN32]